MLHNVSLRRSATLLAIAGAIEFALQLAVPIMLVRYLDEHTFGQYRLLWLMANTALVVAPAFMPQSLFYFLSRAEANEKGLIVGNVILYCALAGALAAILSSGWNPWMQQAASALFFQTHGVSACFLALWIVASIVDILPTADGKPHWQATTTIWIAVIRAAALVTAALSGAGIFWIAVAMLAVAGIKVFAGAYYIYVSTSIANLRSTGVSMAAQLKYAFPFAVGNALFLLRSQGDQWIVVSLTTPTLYAVFSIAAVALLVGSLIRQPVINAMMPRLNAAHASGNKGEIVRLIAKSNGAAGMLLLPVVGGLFASAPTLVDIVYTSKYHQAAPIMQVYLVGMLVNFFAVGHVLPAIGKGQFAALSSFYCLVLSIALSTAGLHLFGLPGAALGSVITLAIAEIWSMRVVASSVAVPMHRLVEWRAFGSTVAGTGAALVGTLILGEQLHLDGIGLLMAEALIYGVLFLLFFTLAGGWKQFDLVLGWPSGKKAVVPS